MTPQRSAPVTPSRSDLSRDFGSPVAQRLGVLGLVYALLCGCSCETSSGVQERDATVTAPRADAGFMPEAGRAVATGGERDASTASESDAKAANLDVTLTRDGGVDNSTSTVVVDAASNLAQDADTNVGLRDASGAIGTDGQDASSGDLVVGSNVSVSGGACGLAYDATRSLLFVYPCSGTQVTGLDADGNVVTTLDAPGENANDVDVDVTTTPLTLAGTELPSGTLLFFNGELDVTEVYAVDVETDAVLSSLVTGFGASHVVGGAHHPVRGSLFLVQDRVPGATDGNQVAEVDPSDGTIVQAFSVAPSFDVNYGDLEVCESTSNLLLVSSNETSIAEFTADGAFVRTQPLPPEVTGLSGIAVAGSSGQIWVASTGGKVTRLDGNLCPPTP